MGSVGVGAAARPVGSSTAVTLVWTIGGLVVALAFALMEIVAALYAGGSRALWVDAAHHLARALGCALVIVVAVIARRRPGSAPIAEIAGRALVAVVLLVSGALLAWDAWQQLDRADLVDPHLTLGAALFSSVVALITALALARVEGDAASRVTAALVLRMSLATALTLVGAAWAAQHWGVTWADALAGLALSGLLVCAGLQQLRHAW